MKVGIGRRINDIGDHRRVFTRAGNDASDKGAMTEWITMRG